MSLSGGVQSACQLTASIEIKADHYDSQAPSYAPSQERVQVANHDYMSGMRESLFRLLSKVPIQIETVKQTESPTGYSPTVSDQQDQQLEPSSSSQQSARVARRPRQPSDRLRDPLVIKYYQEKSLANIIELHFACSLMGDTYHHRSGAQSASKPLSATEYPNHHHQQLVSPNLMAGPRRLATNDAATRDRKPRSMAHQRATSNNKLLQRDKFNGQPKNVAAAHANNGLIRSKQAILSRRASRSRQQQQQPALLHTAGGMVAPHGGQVAGGERNHGDAMQSYRLVGSYDNRACNDQHQSIVLSDSVQPSCAIIAYDEQEALTGQQDQFVFVGSTSASSQLVQTNTQPQMQPSIPPSASCILDPSQHVHYAPASEPVANHQQLDYNQQQQQQQYQHYNNQFHPASMPTGAQQQLIAYGAQAQPPEACEPHGYHSHAGLAAVHCQSQPHAHQQQQTGRALVWHPDHQVHHYNEQLGANHHHHHHIQCGAQPIDNHQQHTFIHFNVTDLNQMIEQQQQQQQESELQVVSKSQYFQKHQTSYGDHNTMPLVGDGTNMHRNQLIYHNPQPPEVTTPLQPSAECLAHNRQGSSLESNSSSSSCSSSSSSSLSSSSSSSLSTNSSRSAGPTTPLANTDAPPRLGDCLYLEQINPPTMMGGTGDFT